MKQENRSLGSRPGSPPPTWGNWNHSVTAQSLPRHPGKWDDNRWPSRAVGAG